MTFVPQQGRSGNTSVRRTALFWVLMIALAAVLWQMDSKEGPGHGPARAISYSDFMSRVDQNNVAGVRLILSPSTAELRGTLRNPVQNFKVTIPKEVIPDLTERLRSQGVSIEVVERNDANWISLVITGTPLILFLLSWILVMKKRRAQSGPPLGPSPSAAPPQNQPLGD